MGVGKSRQWGLEAAGHIESSQNADMNVHMLLLNAFLHLYSPASQSESSAAQSHWIFPPLLLGSGLCPQRHAHNLMSQVIPQSIKLILALMLIVVYMPPQFSVLGYSVSYQPQGMMDGKIKAQVLAPKFRWHVLSLEFTKLLPHLFIRIGCYTS